MLNFDEERFLRIQSGAVALQPRIESEISACLANGADNLFFAGTGGAGILMEPATLLLRQRSTLPTFCVQPAEICLTGHRQLSNKSIVVIPSLSGTTKESLAVLAYVRAKGAMTVALTGHGDSPLARDAQRAFINFAEDDTSSESFYLQSLFIALAAMNARKELDNYARLNSELVRLPALLLEAKRAFEARAARDAQTIADHDYHIISSAGMSWPEAHYYGMCILEEMQWIRTRPIHSAHFFHGTLELVQKGVHLLLLKGEDASRALVERVERFCTEHTDLRTTLDARDFALPGLGDETRALISPVLFATILERLSAHLEVIRNHPLTTRRYYKRVPY